MLGSEPRLQVLCVSLSHVYTASHCQDDGGSNNFRGENIARHTL